MHTTLGGKNFLTGPDQTRDPSIVTSQRSWATFVERRAKRAEKLNYALAVLPPRHPETILYRIPYSIPVTYSCGHPPSQCSVLGWRTGNRQIFSYLHINIFIEFWVRASAKTVNRGVSAPTGVWFHPFAAPSIVRVLILKLVFVFVFEGRGRKMRFPWLKEKHLLLWSLSVFQLRTTT